MMMADNCTVFNLHFLSRQRYSRIENGISGEKKSRSVLVRSSSCDWLRPRKVGHPFWKVLVLGLLKAVVRAPDSGIWMLYPVTHWNQRHCTGDSNVRAIIYVGLAPKILPRRLQLFQCLILGAVWVSLSETLCVNTFSNEGLDGPYQVILRGNEVISPFRLEQGECGWLFGCLRHRSQRKSSSEDVKDMPQSFQKSKSRVVYLDIPTSLLPTVHHWTHFHYSEYLVKL